MNRYLALILALLVSLGSCKDRRESNDALAPDSIQIMGNPVDDTVMLSENTLLKDIYASNKDSQSKFEVQLASNLLLYEIDLYNQYLMNEDYVKKNYGISDGKIDYYMQLLIDEGLSPIPHVLDSNLHVEYLSYVEYKKYRSGISFDSLAKFKAYKRNYGFDSLERFKIFKTDN